MGLSQSVSIHYAVPFIDPDSSEKPDADNSPAYRAATHPDELVEGLVGHKIQTCWDIFQLGRKEKGDGAFLGKRGKLADGELGEYTWRSYNEVDKLARHVGSGLLQSQCLPTLNFPDEPVAASRELKLIGIYAKNCEEWFILELAANAYNFSLVPLYDTLGPKALNYVLTQTEMPCCVCQKDVMPTLLEVCEGSKLRKVVCLDEDVDSSIVEKLESKGLDFIFWKDLVKKGEEKPTEIAPGNLDNINTICYTSGTTGDPKGVLITQRNFVSVACAIKRGPMSTKALDITKEDVHISYLPLAHVFERIVCQAVFMAGASIGVYGGDTLKLLEDIKHLRPTVFISVPRLFNRIHDKVFGTLSEKPAMMQYLFNSGLNAKLSNLRRKGRTTHAVWDRIVFNKTKNFMGGRLRYMITGGAPLAPVVQERISSLFCCPLLEGYGMTETMGASFFQHSADPVKGSVGGVVAALEFKLQSLPEMDYLVKDDPPRGELCIRGPGVTPGYFRNTEQTKEAFDENGWLHTGDVCMLLPTAAIKIIDRAKNMFKLAQGEYVAPEKVEQVYQQAFLVAQVFCFGYSTKSCLVGVIVPDVEMAGKWAAKNGHEGKQLDELCELKEFYKAVEAETEELAKREELKGFEKIKKFHLASDLFSVENNLLTPTFKLRRHQAKLTFAEQIDSLYASLEP